MRKVVVSLLAAIAVLLALAPAALAYWHPAPTTEPWQWELQGKFELTPGASVFELDGFEYSAANVRAIHREGARAICYLDVGSWEEYRPDASRFPKSSLGARYEGYPEERWLDIAHYRKFAPIIKARIALCARKGFDAVEPDNINGWENKTGFPLTSVDQIAFNRWIAREVHRAGMAVALKNDIRQVKQLVGAFDFAVVEECFEYHECGRYEPFVEAGKAVFETEYELSPEEFCDRAEELRFSSIRKDYELFARPWEPCEAPGPGTH